MKNSLLIVYFATSLLLTGCGFHLRGQNTTLPQNHAVYVSSLRAHDALAAQLIDTLNTNAVNVVQQPDSNRLLVQVQILDTELERRLLSVYAGGQVAEYELIYSVNYIISVGDQEPRRFTFNLLNDYQDNPDQPLAKSRELSLIMEQLRMEAAERILQNIASITTTN